MLFQILAKGQLQVSKEERDHMNGVTYTEVARLVTDRCVNPDTQRPYTIAQIERAMKDIHFSIRPSQGLFQRRALRLRWDHITMLLFACMRFCGKPLWVLS
jgi:hypothetical protein